MRRLKNDIFKVIDPRPIAEDVAREYDRSSDAPHPDLAKKLVKKADNDFASKPGFRSVILGQPPGPFLQGRMRLWAHQIDEERWQENRVKVAKLMGWRDIQDPIMFSAMTETPTGKPPGVTCNHQYYCTIPKYCSDHNMIRGVVNKLIYQSRSRRRIVQFEAHLCTVAEYPINASPKQLVVALLKTFNKA